MTAQCTLWTGLHQELLPQARRQQPHLILCMAVIPVYRHAAKCVDSHVVYAEHAWSMSWSSSASCCQGAVASCMHMCLPILLTVLLNGCTGSGDNSICVFEETQIASSDVNPQQKPSFQLSIRKLDAHPTDVNCVRWHPKDPSLLASAGDDGCIRLWGYQKGLDMAGKVLEAGPVIESSVT